MIDFDEKFRNFGKKKEKISKTELSKINDYIKINFGYIFLCKYDGLNYPKCENNYDGLCKTVYSRFPFHLIHSYDGKNIIKCLCG